MLTKKAKKGFEEKAKRLNRKAKLRGDVEINFEQVLLVSYLACR